MTEESEKLRQVSIGLKPVQLDQKELENLEKIPQRVQTLDIYGVKINICTSLPLFREELFDSYERFFSDLSLTPDSVVHFYVAEEIAPLTQNWSTDDITNVLECAHNSLRVYIIPKTEELGNFFLSVMQVALFRILLDCQLFCAHASAASVGSAGVLFSGESSSGKTTLVMALLAEGCKYFSDDMVLINTDTMMLLPLCSRLKPRGETISMFPQIDSVDARVYMEAADQKRKVLSVEHSLPHLLSDPCPLTHIFFPTFAPEGETVLQPMSSSDAVLKFLRSWKLYSTEPKRVLPLVSKVVKTCKVYRLEYREAKEAARKILEVIRGGTDVSEPL